MRYGGIPPHEIRRRKCRCTILNFIGDDAQIRKAGILDCKRKAGVAEGSEVDVRPGRWRRSAGSMRRSRPARKRRTCRGGWVRSASERGAAPGMPARSPTRPGSSPAFGRRLDGPQGQRSRRTQAERHAWRSSSVMSQLYSRAYWVGVDAQTCSASGCSPPRCGQGYRIWLPRRVPCHAATSAPVIPASEPGFARRPRPGIQ